MPFIKVQSTASPDAQTIKTLLESLSAKLAQHLGKSENYVMTAFEGEVPMTFGGTPDRVCFLEVKNIGTMKPEQTKTMSQDFCQTIARVLDVPSDRIYIEFADAQRHLWGWKETTF
ncbi:MAG: phenylpyruvate tautomerase MIF-related protein [Cyanobacteria bacterium P01_E01_bin.42]